jgi:hypothetical protein
MNELAYSELIQSMDTTTSGGKVAFNIIRRSKTDEFPDGNSALAWHGLKRKYMPNSAPSLTKIHKQLYSAVLKRKVDPDTFSGYLEDLRTQMSDMDSEMTDNQFMIHVTNNLTKNYENTVDNLEGQIGNDENPLDIEELREKLCLRYVRLNLKVDESDSDKEKALFGSTQFKGRCCQCGKYGHKSAGCCSKGGNGNGGNNNGGGNDRSGTQPNFGNSSGKFTENATTVRKQVTRKRTATRERTMKARTPKMLPKARARKKTLPKWS